jgi:hypothetical protein
MSRKVNWNKKDETREGGNGDGANPQNGTIDAALSKMQETAGTVGADYSS